MMPNSDTDNTPTTNIAQRNDQSFVILQQFSMITKGLKNFTNIVSGDITKVTQAYNTSQGKTGKLIENATSQALRKAQSITAPATLLDTRNLGTNYATPHETSWTSAWLTYNYNMSQQPEINTHQVCRPYDDCIPPQTCRNQDYPSQTSLDLNQSIVNF